MPIEDDKLLLANFVEELYMWLDWCHNSRHVEGENGWPILYPRNDFSDQARDSWQEFLRTEPRDRLLSSIHEVTPEQMIRAGLSGKQLRYKLSVLRDLASRALADSSLKEKFADLIETILESLLEMLNVGTATKELVGVLKGQLD